jgi:hypothetical protein
VSLSPKYLRWKIVDGRLFGTTSNGRTPFELRKAKRAGKWITYLDRLDDRGETRGIEVVKSFKRGKAYADELARLANFEPY